MKNLVRALFIIFISILLMWPVSTFGQLFEQNLFYGMKRNTDVARLQKILAERGFYHGSITGNFHKKTRDAVKKFQKAHNIRPASGYFNKKTRAVFNKLLRAASQSASHATVETELSPDLIRKTTVPIIIPSANFSDPAVLPGGPPVATTNGATNQTKTSAVLNGHISPNNTETTYWFEYGITPSLEYSIPHKKLESLTGFISVKETLSNLAPKTVYYLRTVAQNAFGISYGTTVNFVTSENIILQPPDKLLFEEAFNARLAAFSKTISFDEAISKFQRLIDEYPQSELADDAQLLIIYLLFQKPDGIAAARQALQLLKSKWPQATANDPRTVELSGWKFDRGCSGEFDNEALLKLPMAMIAHMELAGSYRHRFVPGTQENFTQALAEYKKLIAEYTGTQAAASAQLNLFLIYGDLGNLQKQIEENEKFINDYPRHVMVPFAYQRGGDLINRKFADKKKLDEYREKFAASFSATDYFYESSTGSNCRPLQWKKNRLMVTIDPAFSSEQRGAIQESLERWSEAVDGKIIFDLSQRLPKPSYFYQPDGADLYIEMIPVNEPTPGVAGKTVTHSSSNIIEQAMVALPGRLSISKLKEVALHEIGHVLGLEHSFNRSDIMFFTSSVSGLSDRDKNTIRRIYAP